MNITHSNSPKEKHTRQTSQKENVRRLPKNQQTTTRSHQGRWWKRMYLTHTTPKNRRTLCKASRLQSFFQFGPQIRILSHRPKGFCKTKISIRLIIPRQVPVQQSPIQTSTSTSIFPETDQRCTERMQLCNGLFRRQNHLQQIQKRTPGTLRGDIHKTESSRTETRKVLFFQKTHTVSGTFNFGIWNSTPTREALKYRQNACTMKP